MEVDDYFDNEEIDEFKNAKNKLKSEEEIEQLSISEEFSTSDKLLHILNNGSKEQKESIITFLDEYLAEAGVIDPINKLMDLIPHFDSYLQELSAISLTRCIEKKLINGGSVEKLELQILKLYDENPNEELYKNWTPTFISCIVFSKWEFLRQNILPKILNYIDFKQVEMTNIVGAKLVAEIATIAENSGELKGNLLKNVQDLCQYNNWKIRLLLATKIKEICKNMETQVFETKFLEELLELGNDEEIQVRLEAVESGFSLIGVMSKKKFQNEFFPIFLKLLSAAHEETQYSMTKSLPRILNLLMPINLLKNKEWAIFEEFMNNLFKSNDPQIIKETLGIVSEISNIFRNNKRNLDLEQFIGRCSKSKEISIKEVLGNKFNEIMKDSSGEYIYRAFINLTESKEESVKYGLVEGLAEVVNRLLSSNMSPISLLPLEETRKPPRSARPRLISSSGRNNLRNIDSSLQIPIPGKKVVQREEREEREREKEREEEKNDLYENIRIAVVNIGAAVKNKSWRLYSQFLQIIPTIAPHFDHHNFTFKYLESALHTLLLGVYPLKVSAAICISSLLNLTYSKSDRIGTIKRLAKLSESPSCYERISFLCFAQAFLAVFSSQYVIKHILEPFQLMSKDKQSGIRLKYCTISPLLFRRLNGKNQAIGDAILENLEKLQNDPDAEVQNRAEEIMFKILSIEFWNSQVKKEEELFDQSQIDHENTFIVLEDQEEEIKKREEELPHINELEYLQFLSTQSTKKEKGLRKRSGPPPGKAGQVGLRKMTTTKAHTPGGNYCKYLLAGGSSSFHRASTDNLKKRKSALSYLIEDKKITGKKMKNEDLIKLPTGSSKYKKKRSFDVRPEDAKDFKC